MVNRLLLISSLLLTATGFISIAISMEYETNKLEELMRTNKIPPPSSEPSYLWSLVFQHSHGQLDSMEVETTGLDDDFGVLEVDNEKFLVTVDGAGHMNYQAINVARIVEIKLIAD